MINWILNLWRSITGDIRNVVKWITHAIAAVYSFIDRLVGELGKEISFVWHASEALYRTVWNFVTSVYNLARMIIDVLLRDLTSWITGLWNDVFSYAKSVYQELVGWADFLRNLIYSVGRDIEQWVIRDIWHPLYGDISRSIHWITHEGAYVYNLLTHPEVLAKLLAKWLWAEYLILLRRYGKVIGHWLLHSMPGLAGSLLDILETILSGIL